MQSSDCEPHNHDGTVGDGRRSPRCLLFQSPLCRKRALVLDTSVYPSFSPSFLPSLHLMSCLFSIFACKHPRIDVNTCGQNAATFLTNLKETSSCLFVFFLIAPIKAISRVMPRVQESFPWWNLSRKHILTPSTVPQTLILQRVWSQKTEIQPIVFFHILCGIVP